MRCYLYPVPHAERRPIVLHETGGLNGNWALDFMCEPGSNVLAPHRLEIRRLSGHSPTEGELPGAVFGFSIHAVDEDGYGYFFTHLSRRFVKQGQVVCPATKLATVGHWPKDRGRTHLHLGVSSPEGEADAKAQVRAIARAVRVGLL